MNNAYYRGETTVIERHGKPIAKIVPIEDVKERSSRFERRLKAINKYAGSIPDFPDVTKLRNSRKKWPVL